MAVTRIWPVKGQLGNPISYAINPEKTKNETIESSSDLEALGDVMNYAVNEEKTEKQFFVSGINCNVETARSQFQTVKKQFDKEDGVIAYHGYQSFAKDEVTPEVAHQIGIEMAEKLWGKDYQVVVATHLNTQCLHNHFVVNSISYLHGKRCRIKQWRDLKEASDEICKNHKLSVIEKGEGTRLPYQLMMAEKRGEPTRLVLARRAVDIAVNQSGSMQEFYNEMKKQGYTFSFQDSRKYWTIQQKNWKRPMRLYRLGEEYTNLRLEERIKEEPVKGRVMLIQKRNSLQRQYNLPSRYSKLIKHRGYKRLYLKYCYQLGYLPKYTQRPERVHYLFRDDLLKLSQISEETKFLCREEIQTQEQLSAYEESMSEKLQVLGEKRKVLQRTIQRVSVDKSIVEVSKERVCEITEEMKSIRKLLKHCKEIAKRSRSMEENLEKWELEQNKSKTRKER